MSSISNIMVVTPCAPGTVLAPCCLPLPRLTYAQDYPYIPVREQRINLNRFQCQRLFLRRYFGQFEFALLVDSDVVIRPKAIPLLLAAWEPGKVPCANTKGPGEIDPGHGVVTSCALIHRADYAKVDYLGNLGKCQCRILGEMFKTFYVEGCCGYEVSV